MKFELRPALVQQHVGNTPVSVPTTQPEDFGIYVDGQCHGYLYACQQGYALGLALPGQAIEYHAVVPSKEVALGQIEKVIPILVGNPVLPPDPHSDGAAAAALHAALDIAADESDERAMEFLHLWSSPERSAIRTHWPEVSEDVFGT